MYAIDQKWVETWLAFVSNGTMPPAIDNRILELSLVVNNNKEKL
jgi:hypothetical protein